MASPNASNLALALFGLVHGPGVIDTGGVVDEFAERLEAFFKDFDSNFYEVPDREWAEQRVDLLFNDLRQRALIGDVWDATDSEIQDEVKERWITLLRGRDGEDMVAG